MAANYTGRALAWSSLLVHAYTESGDADLARDVAAVLREVGEHEGELESLVASLTGIAGQAVMAIAARVEADFEPEENPERRNARLLQRRTSVLDECITALRELRTATLDLPAAAAPASPRPERRSRFDRRLGTDRRRHPPVSAVETVNLRLFGERRAGVTDRRSGLDRRRTHRPPSDEAFPDELAS